MKKLIFTLSILSFLFNFVKVEKVNAQLTGVKNIPGNYATLASAISDLNTNGVGVGGVTLNLLPGNPQTAPAGGYRLTAIGNALNSIFINGNGNIITASGSQPIGSIKDAVFLIKGGDYITIEGFVIKENPLNNINNDYGVNNMTEWGIAFLHANQTNGSQYNTIKECNISLNKNYTNTFGIYSNSRHDTNNVQSVNDITSITGANNNNKIYGNIISNVGRPILFVGSSDPLYMNSGNDVGGFSSASSNSITDWSTAPANSYVSVPSGSMGISLTNEKGSNISYNSIYGSILANTLKGIQQSFNPNPEGIFSNTISNNKISLNATTLDLGGLFYAIHTYGGVSTMTMDISNNIIYNCFFNGNSWNIQFINNSSQAKKININYNILQGNISFAPGFICSGIINYGNAIDSVNINNNQIGNSSGGILSFSGGSFDGIFNSAGTSPGSVSISNNNFQGLNYTSASSSQIRFISNFATNCGSININSNSFNNLSVNTSGNIYFINNNVTRNGGSSCNVNGNSIITAFNNTGTGGNVRIYYGNNSSPVNTVESNSDNNFSNITLNGGNSYLSLWESYDQCGKLISNNTFDNISGSGTFIGLYVYGSDTLSSVRDITDNTIRNVTANGLTSGILSNGKSLNIYNNNINSLLSTGSSLVTGISSTTAVLNVYNNKIYNLQTNNANGTVNGISLTSGRAMAYNNLIGELKAISSNSSNDPIRGINVNGATANLFFNTIFLNAVSSGANFSTCGIYHQSSSSSTFGSLLMQNNIIVNYSTPNGNGKAVAFKRSSASLNNYNFFSNNNLFCAGLPGTARLIYFDGSNSDQTISSYKSRVIPRDSLSFSENPNFLSVSGSNSGFLHIDSTVATQISNGGINVPGIVNDYDGNTRDLTTPDVGADEFNGVFSLNLSAIIQGFYNEITDSMVQDTISVYIRNSLSPYFIVDSSKGLLNSSGTGVFTFNNLINGIKYYIQLKHRNSIETWSDSAKPFDHSNLTLDFTDSYTKAYGNNLIQVDDSPIKFAVYNGNVNQDALIDLSDVLQVYNDASLFNSGYIVTDVNGDNITDLSDVLITSNNSNNFVSVIRP